MASPSHSDIQNHATTSLDYTRSEEGDTASILSSRMTDIASEDGREHGADSAVGHVGQSPSQRRSMLSGDGVLRPDTGVTGASSQRGASPQAPPSRRGFAPANLQRGSIPNSMSDSSIARPPSAPSKTHVPSLTSHAFFRPMSSQRLQAQRGGPRPVTMTQQGMSENGSVEDGSTMARNSVISNQTAMQSPGIHEDGDVLPPPSRGTEMTAQETMERVTANTSLTQGHHTTGSLSESVRPLQQNPANTKGLSLNVDTSYKNGGRLSTPSKSPRSFRSSFLLPTRGNPVPNSPNRSTQGREKLESVASSPGLAPSEPPKKIVKQNLGSNYQYFTGNTVFWWGGRLQNTRSKPINIATGMLVIIPSVLFFVFSAPWLWHHISPAIPIVYGYVFYISLSSFIHASVSDPGVSPQCPLYLRLGLTNLDIATEPSPDASCRAK